MIQNVEGNVLCLDKNNSCYLTACTSSEDSMHQTFCISHVELTDAYGTPSVPKPHVSETCEMFLKHVRCLGNITIFHKHLTCLQDIS